MLKALQTIKDDKDRFVSSSYLSVCNVKVFKEETPSKQYTVLFSNTICNKTFLIFS